VSGLALVVLSISGVFSIAAPAGPPRAADGGTGSVAGPPAHRVPARPAASRPTPTPSSDLAPPASGAGESDLAARFRGYLADRPGQASVAIYDAVTGRTVAFTDPAAAGFETASTVKLAILVALLEQAGPAARLSESERREATAMINVSDNVAASSLWSAVGGAPSMDDEFHQLGMTATVADPANMWGLTSTTAADQLSVLRTIAYPNPVLNVHARAIADELLDGVIPAQRWGIPGGVPPGVTVEVKNGWLPRAGGWVINSLAHVHGAGRDYVMAAYTRQDPSMQAGIDTIVGLSKVAWNAVGVRAPTKRTSMNQP
jgi:beta-lactamase class A